MIENTAKSIRRKQTVDDKYIDNLYLDVASLYRLDHFRLVEGGRENLGPLPAGSVALLVSLAIVWACLGAWLVYGIQKKRKSENTH